MKKNILVVDDEFSMRKLLTYFLSKDYNVITFENGFDALSYLQENDLPDLAIVDINMPKVNGFEFLQNVKSSLKLKAMPVVILSMVDSSSERVKFLKAGAEDFLIKPFNPEELELKVSKLFAR